MSDIAKKVLLSIVLSIPTAIAGVVLRGVFQAWGIFDPFSEWLGGWLKVHITPAQVEWTIAGIVALLAYAALSWIVWRYHRISPFTDANLSTHIPEPQRDIIGGNLQPESMQQIGSNDLQIIIGRGNNYEKVERSNQNTVTRTVRVGVKNDNPKHFISNCELFIKLPNEDVFRPFDNNSFTLNPGEEKFFNVAYRHYYIVKNNEEIDSIQFSIPDHGGTFWSGGPRYWVPKGAYFITLKAEAFEVRPYEIVCKLWVDENDKLRLDRA